MPSTNYDIDARNDPLFLEYERARDLIPTQDWRRGLEELERLSHQGSIMSILFVADAMRVGSMYEPDLPGAEAWYKVAEKSGSVRGTFGLGLTYLRMGRIAEARRKLEEAISKNYPPAFNALAGIYFRGDGAAQDLQRARDLWRKGASLGHLPARRNLLAQQLRGRYGVLDFIAGVISFVPTIASIVSTRLKNPYTDLLR